MFFVGLHQPSDARHFDRCCLSIARLRDRYLPWVKGDVLIDSGAFSTLLLHGGYPDTPEAYAAELLELATSPTRIVAAVTQDYMCEPFMLAKTGLSIKDHQRLTIERYDALTACLAGRCPFPVMPVLQGYAPTDYARHVHMYGKRLTLGHWTGVGSVCKRNGKPKQIVEVLSAIHDVRPDLRLHGFGVKKTALLDKTIRDHLYSADSMAWSLAARRKGGNQNSRHEAQKFVDMIELILEPGVFG